MLEEKQIIAERYQLLRPLGVGGMGQVWVARDRTLGREVAVKVMSAAARQDPKHEERFMREARLAARVKHRCVVGIHDFGATADGHPYMVLEHLHGMELGQWMWEGPAAPVREAIRFVSLALSGLQAVHDANVVHRDLKPENIFVVEEEGERIPKVLDFGISKRTDGAAPSSHPPPSAKRRRRTLTEPGKTLGTPSYMSPEQLKCTELDGRSDVFAMGLILFEWLTGKLPYEEENLSTRLVTMLSRPANLRAERPDLGADLSDTLAKALAFEPNDRFASAREMAVALRACAARVPEGAMTMVQSEFVERTVPATVQARGRAQARTRRRPARRVVLAVSLVALAVAGVVGGLWMAREKAPADTPEVASPAAASRAPQAVPTAEPTAPVVPAPAAPFKPIVEPMDDGADDVAPAPPAALVEPAPPPAVQRPPRRAPRRAPPQPTRQAKPAPSSKTPTAEERLPPEPPKRPKIVLDPGF